MLHYAVWFMQNLSENCKQSAKLETTIQRLPLLYSKNPNMELDSFLLNEKMKYKIVSIISSSLMEIQDEDMVSSKLWSPSFFLITFAQFFCFIPPCILFNQEELSAFCVQQH